MDVKCRCCCVKVPQKVESWACRKAVLGWPAEILETKTFTYRASTFIPAQFHIHGPNGILVETSIFYRIWALDGLSWPILKDNLWLLLLLCPWVKYFQENCSLVLKNEFFWSRMGISVYLDLSSPKKQWLLFDFWHESSWTHTFHPS